MNKVIKSKKNSFIEGISIKIIRLLPVRDVGTAFYEMFTQNFLKTIPPSHQSFQQPPPTENKISSPTVGGTMLSPK